jgi:hypothetical protein
VCEKYFCTDERKNRPPEILRILRSLRKLRKFRGLMSLI